MIVEDNSMKFYTLEDIATFLKIRPRTVYKHLSEGHLKGIKLGNKWRFTEQHIKNYIQVLEKRVG